MSLLVLAAGVCRTFVEQDDPGVRTVQKVKAEEPRDVVTALDLRLHEVSERFAALSLRSCAFLSEESHPEQRRAINLTCGQVLVVDPLDGSNNFALGMPGYGFMAAQVDQGVVVGAVVVVPERDAYVVLEAGLVRSSVPVGQPCPPSGTTYYAYPPQPTETARRNRPHVLAAIDSLTAGVYRSGSACAGLFNLLTGGHAAFVGYEVRIWDALAFLPLLEHFGHRVHYRIQSERITVVASLDHEIADELARVAAAGEAPLTVYEAGSALVVA